MVFDLNTCGCPLQPSLTLSLSVLYTPLPLLDCSLRLTPRRRVFQTALRLYNLEMVMEPYRETLLQVEKPDHDSLELGDK